jgi:hypothetical protein
MLYERLRSANVLSTLKQPNLHAKKTMPSFFSLSRFANSISLPNDANTSWRRKREQHVVEIQDSVLFPLLHFVLDDLPTGTKSPDIDNLRTVSDGLVAKYLLLAHYLEQIFFRS